MQEERKGTTIPRAMGRRTFVRLSAGALATLTAACGDDADTTGGGTDTGTGSSGGASGTASTGVGSTTGMGS
ncbi:MAG: hypothetical protein D6705_00175, partial [Deltaproteobacteria bacterium]